MTTDLDGFGHGTVRLLSASVCVLAFAVLSVGCDVDLDIDQNVYACNTSEDCRDGYNCVAVPDKTRRECRLADAVDVTDANDTTPPDTSEDTGPGMDTSELTDVVDTNEMDADDDADASEDASTTENSPETCSDGADNDSDGNTDCRDSDCLEVITCSRHVVFVTRAEVRGDIGGMSVTGANDICQREARDANRAENGWRAMIADDDRPIQEAVSIEGPIWSTDETLLATRSFDFWNALRTPIAVYADGSQLLTDSNVWTGMDADVNNLGELCGDNPAWSTGTDDAAGHFGSTSETDNTWYSSSITAGCGRDLKLFCISGQ